TLHLDYTLPTEDPGPDADELADSHTQQFFAFRRLDYLAAVSERALPNWITQADLDRAAQLDPVVAQAIAAHHLPGDEVLESTSPFAAADWVRITADDARVPITNVQAQAGIDWDLGGLAPGTYTLWGYTWFPPHDLWSPRAGFVKLVASAAEHDDAGP